MAAQHELKKYAQLLELLPVVEAPHLASPKLEIRDGRRRRGRTYILLFAGLFLLPSLLAVVIFGFVLSDRYEAEARFVIRSSGRAATSALTSFLQSTGVARATDEAYALREFMLSRDAMRDLQENYGLLEAFSRPQADIFWRFPNFYMPRGEEGLFREYQRMVAATYDPTSGVTTVRIQGFEAGDAYRLAEGLIRSAEAFVNKLNERSRRDAVNVSMAGVAEMESRVVNAQLQLTAYRNRERLLDPGQDSFIIIEGIAKLSLEAVEASMQIRQVERASPNSPQIAALRGRLVAIEGQVARERGRLAGDAASLSSKIAEYERLVLEREFSERALFTALGAVELSRVEAQRQHIYLERVATSSRPDYPKYPYRVLWILVVSAISFVFYKVVAAFALDARRHGEA
jgi:capsular polysaccharide transport system permease protein